MDSFQKDFIHWLSVGISTVIAYCILFPGGVEWRIVGGGEGNRTGKGTGGIEKGAKDGDAGDGSIENGIGKENEERGGACKGCENRWRADHALDESDDEESDDDDLVKAQSNEKQPSGRKTRDRPFKRRCICGLRPDGKLCGPKERPPESGPAPAADAEEQRSGKCLYFQEGAQEDPCAEEEAERRTWDLESNKIDAISEEDEQEYKEFPAPDLVYENSPEQKKQVSRDEEAKNSTDECTEKFQSTGECIIPSPSFNVELSYIIRSFEYILSLSPIYKHILAMTVGITVDRILD